MRPTVAPLLGWLLSSKIFLDQGRRPAKPEFLKNLGSNFVVKDSTLCFSYLPPFDRVAKTTLKKNWLAFLDDLRTFCLMPEYQITATLIEIYQIPELSVT